MIAKQIRWVLVAGWGIVFFCMGIFTAEAATLGSHYPFGGEGVLAASVPPPGFHYRIYNTWYNPTTLKDDNGPGTLADERKESYALGAEINLFWLPPTLFQVNLRALREFGAENTVQGAQFVLTLTKSW